MANTSAVYARIDTDLKQKAEEILNQLGISPSSAVQMLYSQIVLTNGLPFQPKLPYSFPPCVDNLSKEAFDEELRKGYDAVKAGKTYTQEEVDALLKQNFGI